MPPMTDVIIIGAGASGLVTAKTYLEITSSPSNPHRHPINLTILDDASSPGGVWSRQRLYPGLLANIPNGFYEFSDLSMVDDDHPKLEWITGQRVSEYMERYARMFGVYDKIRFDTKVAKVRRRDGPRGNGWVVATTKGEVLECDKLIVASGLYSKPRKPDVPMSMYKGISIHSKELGSYADRIAEDDQIKNVVVVGGCKSAVEACCVFLAAGKKVRWVVRPNERGVPIVVLDKDAKPNLIGANMTRFFSVFSPSVMATHGFWYTFLHSGRWRIGTKLVSGFWKVLTKVMKKDVKYCRSENGKKIEPERASFLYNLPFLSPVVKESPFLDILHEDNPERLMVHRAKILELYDRKMKIQEQNGEEQTLSADAVIWSIGWEPTGDFFEPKEAARLGLSVPRHEADTEDEKEWANLKSESEIRIQRILPMLNEGQPRVVTTTTTTTEPSQYTPFRLYRQVLPTSCLASTKPTDNHNMNDSTAIDQNDNNDGATPNQNNINSTDNDENQEDHSITFPSFTASGQTPITFELLALYTTTWLESLLPPLSIPTTHQAKLTISDLETSREIKYGPRAIRDPGVVLESQALHDLICRDLGVDAERKRRRIRKEKGDGWMAWMEGGLREWFEPYLARDYRGLGEEFLRKRFGVYNQRENQRKKKKDE